MKHLALMFLVGFALCGRAAVAQNAIPQDSHQQGSPDAVAITIIIKSAIIALHQANITGNYSVLRDLGTPVFRERFNQASLTAIFADLRNSGVNLYPAILLSPELTSPPSVNGQGQLQLEGRVPSQPLEIRFKVIAQPIDGQWRIEGLVVNTIASPASASAQPEAGAWSAQPEQKDDKKKEAAPR